MSCSDVCVVMDYEGSNEFYRDGIRRAAKGHRCIECQDAILVGESHHYAVGKTDGEFWECRTCAPCAEIRTAFVCDRFVFTTLWEEIQQQLFPEWDEMMAIDCLAKLTTPAAVEKMRAEYAFYRGDAHA